MIFTGSAVDTSTLASSPVSVPVLGVSLPYVDALQGMEEALMKGAKRETLERYADLLMMDIRTLYGSIEKMVKTMGGKKASSHSPPLP